MLYKVNYKKLLKLVLVVFSALNNLSKFDGVFNFSFSRKQLSIQL